MGAIGISMIERDQAIQIVSSQGWLSEQPTEFRRRFLKHATLQHYDAGQTVFEAGDIVADVLGLVDGALEIYFTHPHLGRGLIHIAVRGIWVGEQLAYGLDRRVTTLRAKIPTSVLCVPAEDVELMLAEDPYRLKSFGRLTETHITECLKIIQELLHNNSLIRVSARLITLSVAHTRGALSGPISLPISQDELAALCGLSRKITRRVLGVLSELRVISVKSSSIEILDLQGLGEISSRLSEVDAEIDPDE
jgi:CRP/FNR family cyclic AMP-dependent transcriptional regulator